MGRGWHHDGRQDAPQQFHLRLPNSMHQQLGGRAEKQGVWLNTLIAELLGSMFSPETRPLCGGKRKVPTHLLLDPQPKEARR
ncbi:MAG: toxin-antitoxin system HicB family antitoxin [Solirubrobacteraceae bacterium]